MTAQIYAYRALDSDGEMQKGDLAGESRDSVAERIRRMGLRPVMVKRRKVQIASKEIAIPRMGGHKADALAVFSRQFATMADAGTPIIRCLDVLGGQTDDASLATAINEVKGNIENGDSLSVALSHQPQWFNRFYIAMVESGEQAGSLPLVLERLAVATERTSRLRKKVKSAMAYPTAVACLIALTVVAMLVFLIPTFTGIFEDLDGTLPLPTRIVVGASELLTGYFPFLLIMVAAAVFGLRRWYRTDAGRVRLDRWKLKIPVFGKLIQLSALARFSRSLSVLVSTGVPAMDALRIAKSTAGNMVVEQAAEDIAEGVSNGQPIAHGMSNQPIFTAMVTQMVSVGEETGSVDEMLEKVADVYETEVSTTVDGLTALLEPMLIVLMGITVGGMLMAVYLPMFRAVSLVN